MPYLTRCSVVLEFLKVRSPLASGWSRDHEDMGNFIIVRLTKRASCLEISNFFFYFPLLNITV